MFVSTAGSTNAMLTSAFLLPWICHAPAPAAVGCTVVATPFGTLPKFTLSNLNFGSVSKGVATTVQPTAAGAGAWQIQGSKNADVSMAFVLPAVLTNIQALPGSTMPISFGATSARWNRATNNVAGATAFNPVAGTTGKLGPPANPFIYLWIGGTVSPAAATKPGVYTGTIIVTIAYL